jgi:hypothetical protein
VKSRKGEIFDITTRLIARLCGGAEIIVPLGGALIPMWSILPILPKRSACK